MTTYITEVSVPSFGDGGIQRLSSKGDAMAKEPKSEQTCPPAPPEMIRDWYQALGLFTPGTEWDAEAQRYEPEAAA
jgi:hypothetical protein